jgi:hypothetical protein
MVFALSATKKKIGKSISWKLDWQIDPLQDHQIIDGQHRYVTKYTNLADPPEFVDYTEISEDMRVNFWVDKSTEGHSGCKVTPSVAEVLQDGLERFKIKKPDFDVELQLPCQDLTDTTNQGINKTTQTYTKKTIIVVVLEETQKLEKTKAQKENERKARKRIAAKAAAEEEAKRRLLEGVSEYS